MKAEADSITSFLLEQAPLPLAYPILAQSKETPMNVKKLGYSLPI